MSCTIDESKNGYGKKENPPEPENQEIVLIERLLERIQRMLDLSLQPPPIEPVQRLQATSVGNKLHIGFAFSKLGLDFSSSVVSFVE